MSVLLAPLPPFGLIRHPGPFPSSLFLLPRGFAPFELAVITVEWGGHLVIKLFRRVCSYASTGVFEGLSGRGVSASRPVEGDVFF